MLIFSAVRREHMSYTHMARVVFGISRRSTDFRTFSFSFSIFWPFFWKKFPRKQLHLERNLLLL